MTGAALCLLALAIAYAAYRLTTRPLRIEHSLTVAPLVHEVRSELARQWWQAARDVPDPPAAQTAAPVHDEELDDAIESAVAEGMKGLRALYGATGRTISDAELEAEAREMVLAEFGT